MNINDLEHTIATLSKNVVLGAAVILVVLVIAAILLRDKAPKLKPYLFGTLTATLVLPTLFFVVSTVYLNVKSESGGPVHWHAEIEFWACDTELELRDPTGFISNKIGTSTYHEHDDKHIHLEGVVVRKSEDASLGKFMRVTDGSLTNIGMSVPLNQDESTWIASGDKLDGDEQGSLTAEQLRSQFVNYSEDGPVANLINGKSCNDQPAELQTFVYTYNKADNSYSQRKLEDPAEYTISEESSLGPPADCIIFEFAAPKERTDKLCEQYGIKDVKRCADFGVKEHDPELCNLSEVSEGGTL